MLTDQLREHRIGLVCKREHLLAHIQDHVRELADIDKHIASVDILSDTPLTTSQMEIVPNFAGMTVAKACAIILRETRRPMTVRELLACLLAGGMIFKSRTPEHTIAILLQRYPCFAKVARRTFSLVETGGGK